ncbi:MAG: hypothetical protein IIT41_03615 [Oscillospiraceae bacterium]|nr:hypothetical protein [Oscillospiraceae bacterium]
MKKEEKKKAGAAGAAAAVVAAASVAVAGAFSSPAAILDDEDKPSAYVERAEAEESSPESSPDDTEDEEEKKKPGLKATIRNKLLSLPLAVRALLLVPMWAIGTGIIFLLGGLWSVLSPALGKVLGAVALAALVYGIIALGLKALFPNMPIKKLINRKTLPAVCIAGAVAAALDVILPLLFADYSNIRSVVQTVLMTVVAGIAIVSLSAIFSRRKRPEEPAPDPEPDAEPEMPEEITFEDAGGSFKIRTGR